MLHPVGEALCVSRAVSGTLKLRRSSKLRHGAKSWDERHRVIARLEATRLGLDIRYVVTSLTGAAEHLYQAVYYLRRSTTSLSIESLGRGAAEGNRGPQPGSPQRHSISQNRARQNARKAALGGRPKNGGCRGKIGTSCYLACCGTDASSGFWNRRAASATNGRQRSTITRISLSSSAFLSSVKSFLESA